MAKDKINTHKAQMEKRERLRAKRERIAGLKALMETWEDAGNIYEARRVQVKLRLAEQELRYMGEDDAYASEVEINLTEKHL
jgi:hypothetical protein